MCQLLGYADSSTCLLQRWLSDLTVDDFSCGSVNVVDSCLAKEVVL